MLNSEQQRAVEAVRGPVCILAGAGSGKTTTITHRVANQVESRAFRADEILAVTFTDKAAGEMRGRLEQLGVPGVRCATFHAAALGQLRFFAAEQPGRILASKVLPLRYIGNSLPRPYRFRPAADLATEVEWAKNRRIAPAGYLGSLGEHQPPIPEDLMLRVYTEYERRKERDGWVDFEDLLELTIQLFDEDAGALEQVRGRYQAFTVDEYQDVNLLQQTLLDRWLGARDDLCAVGDDYQSIYAFTGASPEYLLAMPKRFPQATIVRLEENYRSTPEILEFANRLVSKLGGAEKVLRATRPAGPEPITHSFAGADLEADFIVERIRELHEAGLPHEEMAILFRTNARSADYEEALSEAGIPSQGAALMAREAAKQLLKAMRGRPLSDVRHVAREQGMLETIPDRLGEREVTRQNDLARLVRLAEEFEGTVEGFVAYLQERFGTHAGRGVHLLTYHRAKGLEFEAVFLPRLEEKELPSKLSKTPDAVAEERRLLYVGLTRAKRHLSVTWSGKPSRFLSELDLRAPAPKPVESDDPLYATLKEWRLKTARAEDKPAYVIFHNATLAEIVRRAPQTREELSQVPGVGPAKLERYGDEVLAALAAGA